MKTYYKTTIALGIAIAFSASNAALAMEKDWKFHEDKWQEVISYGTVPIANESAGEWGPWSEFIQPAAGPAVPFLGQAEGDQYRPIPPVIPPTPPVVFDTCPAGAACGYAIYKNKGGNVEYRSSGENSHYYNGYYPATFIAYPTFGEPDEGKWGTKGELDVNFSLAHLNGSNPSDPAPALSDSGDLSGHYYIPPSWMWWLDPSGSASRHDESGGAYIDGELTSKAADQTADGYFKIYAYMQGGGVSEYRGDGGSKTSVEGLYIAGYPTAGAYMDTLRGGFATARYEGREILSGGKVGINVQFGYGTWDGTWSGSGYGKAFGAAGTVTGNQIQSDPSKFSQNVISGQVQGTFYGATAQALAGVADVTLAQKCGPDVRHVDLFATKLVPQKPQ